MGDLDFNELYKLPYWRYLDNKYWQIGIHEEDKQFIEVGCMVMIATMAMEIIDEAGSYILESLNIIVDFVSSYIPTNIEIQKLKELVLSFYHMRSLER